jgi:hypothetical protein
MMEFLAAQPAWLVFIILVGGSVALASVATLQVRRRMKTTVDETHNEVAGLIFAAVSVLYSVVLAFLVISSWEHFSTTEQTASVEAAAIVAVARTTTSFPEPARQQVHDLLLKYSNIVINEELAGARQGRLDPNGSPHILAVVNQIWTIYRGLPPNSVDSDTTAILLELGKEHNLRLQDTEAILPGIFWIILVVGAVITIAFGIILHMKNVQFHVITIALLTGMIVLCLWIIVEINHGDASIAPALYEHAIYVINSLPR